MKSSTIGFHVRSKSSFFILRSHHGTQTDADTKLISNAVAELLKAQGKWSEFSSHSKRESEWWLNAFEVLRHSADLNCAILRGLCKFAFVVGCEAGDLELQAIDKNCGQHLWYGDWSY